MELAQQIIAELVGALEAGHRIIDIDDLTSLEDHQSSDLCSQTFSGSSMYNIYEIHDSTNICYIHTEQGDGGVIIHCGGPYTTLTEAKRAAIRRPREGWTDL